MAVWTVFEPEAADEARTTRDWADGFVFVPERLSWSALPLAPLVLLFHRLWLAFTVYALVQVAVVVAIVLLDLDGDAFALLLVANIMVAVELPGLRRAKLVARGYEEVGTVAAPKLEGAEQRYFEARLGSSVPAAPAPASARAYAPARPAESGVLGLFPEASR